LVRNRFVLMVPAAALSLSGVARAAEPSVAELQRAAVVAARLEDAPLERMRRRARAAAALPHVKVRVGRGAYSTTGDVYGNTPSASEPLRFDVEATWAFDRFVFDRDEVRLMREADRRSERREVVVREVTRLVFARQRLLVQPLPLSGEDQLRVDELTALIDGMTAGALTGPGGPR